MIAANTIVTALAIVTGKLPLNKPYISHKSVPVVKSAYIDKEIPDVSFVWMVFTACGKNETVVQKAANSPIIVMYIQL